MVCQNNSILMLAFVAVVDVKCFGCVVFFGKSVCGVRKPCSILKWTQKKYVGILLKWLVKYTSLKEDTQVVLTECHVFGFSAIKVKYITVLILQLVELSVFKWST